MAQVGSNFFPHEGEWGAGGGVQIIWTFVVLNVFPKSSQWFLGMFSNFPMCSPNIFPIVPHFIQEPLP